MNRNFSIVVVALLVIAAAAIAFVFLQNDTKPNDGAGVGIEETTPKKSSDAPTPEEMATAKAAANAERKAAADPNASKTGQESSVAVTSNEIHGRIVANEARVPVAGAKIWLERHDEAFRYFMRDSKEAIEPTAVANAQGEFTIKNAAAGKDYRLKIEAPGRVRVRHDVLSLTSKEKRELGEIVMNQAAAVEGRVTDTTGGPIAGAFVSGRRAPNPNTNEMFFGPELYMEFEATSDANGRYKIDGFTPGQMIILSATAKGRVGGKTEPFEPKLGTPRVAPDIVLKEGKEITGRVLDRAGAPVQNATINVWRSSFGPEFIFDPRANNAFTTDKDGNFVINGLEDRNVTLNIIAREKGSAMKRGVAPGTRDLMIQLENLGSIKGRIVASGSTDPATLGAMMANLSVEAIRSELPNGPMIFRADSEGENEHVTPEGEFEIFGLEKGKYRVQARGDGIAPAMSQEVEVAADRPVENLQINVTPGAVVVVHVTKAGSAEPIVGAKVKLYEKREGEDEMFKMMGDMGEDDEDGGGTVVTAPRPSGGGAVRAARAVSVARTVTTSGGGAVKAGGRPPRMPRFRGPGAQSEEKPDPVNQTIKTDEQGVAKFTGLPLAAFEVSAKADDYAPSAVEKLNLQDPKTPAEHKINLSQGGTLRGSVARADGSSAIGARVAVSGPEGTNKTRRANVDENGQYNFEHLPPGKYYVELIKKNQGFDGGIQFNNENDTHPNALAAAVDDGKTTTLDLTAPTLSVVSGTVTQAGAPVAGVKVTLAQDNEDIPDADMVFPGMDGGHTATSDANGKFKITDVEAGKYKVSAKKPGSIRAARKDFNVINPKENIEITIPRGAIEGRVVRADGHEPVANATVQILDDSARGDQGRSRTMMFATLDTGGGGEVRTFDGKSSVKTDAEGRYKLEDLPAGKYRVKASAAGLRDGKSEPVDLVEDQRVPDVEVKLEKAASLVGRVTGPGGAARPNVLVTLRKTDDPTPGKISMADSEGRFKFTSLEPGDYKLSGQVMGGAITLGGDDPKAISLKLEAGVETTKDLTVDQ